MNIVEALNEQGINITIRYYGIEALSTGLHVKDLLDGKDIILGHSFNKKIENIDDYIDYVFLDFIMNFKEVLPYVKEEKNKNLLIFFKNATQYIENMRKNILLII